MFKVSWEVNGTVNEREFKRHAQAAAFAFSIGAEVTSVKSAKIVLGGFTALPDLSDFIDYLQGIVNGDTDDVIDMTLAV